jgi:hypothetical protein
LKHPILNDIQGFPTLFMINEKGQKMADYNGERTKGEMLNFILQNSNIKTKSSPLNSFSYPKPLQYQKKSFSMDSENHDERHKRKRNKTRNSTRKSGKSSKSGKYKLKRRKNKTKSRMHKRKASRKKN